MNTRETPSRYPFDEGFYQRVARSRSTFELVESHVPSGTAHGFRVDAGNVFRLAMMERAQILDVDLFNAEDLTEHYASGAQFHIEGTLVTRFTRIWGTPPRSRPIATVINDSVRWLDNPGALRDHKSYGGHCHPHHWVLFAGRHPNTCYDNLRAGLAMLGYSQRHIHDNLNLFEKMGMDPYTGQHTHAKSDARAEDFMEFYAEIPLMVVVSLCPYGDGSVPPARWADTQPRVSPVRIEVLETGIAPLGWPYELPS